MKKHPSGPLNEDEQRRAETATQKAFEERRRRLPSEAGRGSNGSSESWGNHVGEHTVQQNSGPVVSGVDGGTTEEWTMNWGDAKRA